MIPMPRLISLCILTVLIIFLGITFYQVIAPFLLPLFLAGVMGILCDPIYRYFMRRWKVSKDVAAGLTTVAVMGMVLIPTVIGILISTLQLYSFIYSDGWEKIVETIRLELQIDHMSERLQPLLSSQIEPEQIEVLLTTAKDNIKNILLDFAQKSVGGVASQTVGIIGGMTAAVINMGMFMIALYYFLADGPALLAATQKLIPVNQDYQKQLVTKFEKVVRAVVVATFFAAVAQGLATAILLNVVGTGHFFILFMLATLSALIPLVGTWLVWGPCAIWLILQGLYVSAFFVIVIGAAVIGTLDNIVRAYVLHSDAKLHPLLAFVSVLGGLQVMGFWGIFVGPIVASFLHALIEIFNTELREISDEEQVDKQKAGPATETTSTEHPEPTPVFNDAAEPVAKSEPMAKPDPNPQQQPDEQ